MQQVFKMDVVSLGAFNLKTPLLNTPEGQRACQDYGRALGQRFGA